VIGTWHWGFMAQPEPFPERLISAVPAEYFIKSRMMIRGGTGIGFLTDAAINEYIALALPARAVDLGASRLGGSLLQVTLRS
jgi:hypothetical protein